MLGKCCCINSICIIVVLSSKNSSIVVPYDDSNQNKNGFKGERVKRNLESRSESRTYIVIKLFFCRLSVAIGVI